LVTLVSTNNKLFAAEGAAHFWWDKDFYYIDSKNQLKSPKLFCQSIIEFI
jgi:hypothetical protein